VTRIVLIIGVNGSIGSAMRTRAAGLAGTRVVGFGRTKDPEASRTHRPAYHAVDFSKLESVAQVADLLDREKFERIDCVHCAGHFCQYQTFLEQSVTDIQHSIDANFSSLAFAAKAWLPFAVRARSGHFVAFSSIATVNHFPFLSAYTATKTATESLIKSISNEILIEDVTLNCFSLPTVVTAEEVRLKPHADIKQWIKPEEVAEITFRYLDGALLRPRGATIPFFRSSDTFFGDSVLERYGKSKRDLIL